MIRALIMFMIATPLFALAAVFYEQPEQGWYWYDENQADTQDNAPPISIDSAKQALDSLKKDLQDKKALALMNPTEQNIKQYIQVQNEANKRAETFAMTWQRVIIQNPELDHTIKNPTNAVARRIYHQEQASQKSASIQSFTQRYGLFFFFRSNCAYCHQFAPILKMFEQEYGITVIPVSLDGGGLADYPSPKSDNGIAKKLKVDIVPSVIAVGPKTGEIVPVSFGLVSMDELTYRINLLAQEGAQ